MQYFVNYSKYFFIFRYNGAKKYAEAIDLLYTGSQTLLQHKQVDYLITIWYTCTLLSVPWNYI